MKPKIDCFIEGLDSIRSIIKSSSFYNSSAGEASFELERYLTSAEIGKLRKLGWSIPSSGKYACFGEWYEE